MDITKSDGQACVNDSNLTQDNDLNAIASNPLKRKLNVTEEIAGSKHKCPRKASQPGFTDAKFEESEYYFENGLRKVYPYYFTYSTFCKGRWVGKPLLDVFTQEFRAHTKEQYEKNILSGCLKVNGKLVDIDYKLKESDCITNNVHRHEIAVLATPIKVIHLNEELVVIDKPPSVPVHPCGRYRHNTLLFILAKEHNLKGLHTIHRLDRLTSGVLLFTRTVKKSQELDEQIRLRKVEKQYLCRVEGLFPDGVITCDKPVEVLSPKMGICIVSPSGKECSTVFEKLSYNGKSSVVQCKPLTGRMHQIRVHLQYLGYPIINDPIYNHPKAFGPQKGKDGQTGKSREKLLDDLMKTHNLEKWLMADEEDDGHEDECYENVVSSKALHHCIDRDVYEKLVEKYKKDPNKIKIDTNCDLCQKKYKDPEPKDLIMLLHAYKYKGNGFEFQTDLPIWARDDWTDL